MKKIIMTAKHLDAGGVETFITEIYPYIDKERYSIDFLITQKEENDSKGYFEDELLSQGAKVYRISSKSKSMRKAYKDLKKFFTEHTEYEIFHINDGGGAAFPLFVARKYSKIKTIVHSHNTNAVNWKQNVIMNLFRHYVTSKAYCIGCSKKAAEWMFGKNSSYTELHYGIDTDRFRYDESARKRIREQYGFDKNDFVIGHVGRFNVQKNHTFLIDIFSEYYKRDKNAKLLLVGSGEQEHIIREKIKQENLTDKVVFAGSTKEVEQYMSAMDLFLFPSLFEGFGIVLIEAQTSGIPCLVSDTIPQEVCITDLVRMRNIKEEKGTWADEIERIKNPYANVRYEYSEEVRNKGFDRQETAKHLMQIYEEILNEN